MEAMPMIRYARIDDDLPGAGQDIALWLSPKEKEHYRSWTNSSRRQSWMAGRMLVKQMLSEYLRKSNDAWDGSDARQRPTPNLFGAIHIESVHHRQAAGPPTIWMNRQPQPWRLSIAHTDRLVVAGLTVNPEGVVGVDAVGPLKRPGSLSTVWLTPGERRWLHRWRHPDGVAIIWALKEAIYKAVGCGEPFVPRQIEIYADSHARFRYRSARYRSEDCRLQVERLAQHVIAIATGPADPPCTVNELRLGNMPDASCQARPGDAGRDHVLQRSMVLG